MLWLEGITGEKVKEVFALLAQDLDWSVVTSQTTYLCVHYTKSIGSIIFPVSLLFSLMA